VLLSNESMSGHCATERPLYSLYKKRGNRMNARVPLDLGGKVFLASILQVTLRKKGTQEGHTQPMLTADTPAESDVFGKSCEFHNLNSEALLVHD